MELLHCFQVLDRPELPAWVLTVGANLEPGELEDLSVRLNEGSAGLVRLGDDLFGWRPEPQSLPEPWGARARLVTRRIGEGLLTTLDTACGLLGHPVRGFDYRVDTPVPAPVRFSEPSQATAWLRRHLPVSLATVRAGGRAGLRSLATVLTARLWVCAPTDVSRQWAVDLAEAGTQAAVDDRRPRDLAGLLRLSARWFAAAGDFPTAEAHGVREWVLWKELDDATGMIDTLWRRAHVYRAAGRGNRELDCYQRLLSLYRQSDDRFGLAHTQVARGVALAGVGRARDAAEQLREAARAVGELDSPGAASPGELASVLETLGRALWNLGVFGAARRQFSAALRQLVDVDEQAAQRIRVLLAHPEGHSLPGR
ncbi:tetratricopeptide repeat protein [Saccharothrix sp. NRRL B-16348]|uniref:tetratricopeptide repeat protein n=1 Tax=Saccharothrix sp. NRRL B-16348 TaxID=1415542 RepID=UPI0012FB30C4|nr:tetratricopeptide repeat protein [Saccharothrix sp. NRRL B-16348]